MISYYDPIVGQATLKEAGITAMPAYARVLKYNPYHDPRTGEFSSHAAQGYVSTLPPKDHREVLEAHGYREVGEPRRIGTVTVRTYQRGKNEIEMEHREHGVGWEHKRNGGFVERGESSEHLDEHLSRFHNEKPAFRSY